MLNLKKGHAKSPPFFHFTLQTRAFTRARLLERVHVSLTHVKRYGRCDITRSDPWLVLPFFIDDATEEVVLTVG